LRPVFERRFALRLAAIALFGTVATTLLLLYGARLTDGVSTALLLQAEPVYSLVLAAWVLKEPTPARQVFGTGLVLLGILFVLYDGSFSVGLGGWLILLAPFGWQMSHVLALRVMPPLSPYALTAGRYVYGTIGLFVAQLVFGRSSVLDAGGSTLGMAVFHGAVLFFCGTLFWYETIKRIDLARATVLVTPCEPLISVILVWGLLGALPSLWQLAGLVTLLAGIGVVVQSRRRDAALPLTE
jgi:drug/metabolite transporter (DMT)-like permease